MSLFLDAASRIEQDKLAAFSPRDTLRDNEELYPERVPHFRKELGHLAGTAGTIAGAAGGAWLGGHAGAALSDSMSGAAKYWPDGLAKHLVEGVEGLNALTLPTTGAIGGGIAGALGGHYLGSHLGRDLGAGVERLHGSEAQGYEGVRSRSIPGGYSYARAAQRSKNVPEDQKSSIRDAYNERREGLRDQVAMGAL